MAGTLVAANTVALTSNGTSAGVVTIANTALFPAGTICWLVDDDSDSGLRVKVIKVLTTTTLTVRAIPLPDMMRAPTYGNVSDVSAYTTAKHSTLNCEQQVVDEYASFHSL